MADENDRLKDEIEKLKKAGSNRDVLPQTVVSKPQVTARELVGKTVQQLIPYLRGKTRHQVIDLLGPPSVVLDKGNRLFWDKLGIYSPLKRSNNTILFIQFSRGTQWKDIGLSGEQRYDANGLLSE
jgi:hypothetical protein